MKKLREIARVYIARCEAGDMQAIKELANRLDGRPAQILEHNPADSEPVPADEVSAADDQPVLIERRGVCVKMAATGMNTDRILKIRSAPVFEPLLKPARYKGACGGRGSGKSHFFAGLVVEDTARTQWLVPTGRPCGFPRYFACISTQLASY
jgi:hypothetical protein